MAEGYPQPGNVYIPSNADNCVIAFERPCHYITWEGGELGPFTEAAADLVVSLELLKLTPPQTPTVVCRWPVNKYVQITPTETPDEPHIRSESRPDTPGQ